MTEPTSDTAAFPPDTIEGFLRFCAGEWMSLRSRFALDMPDDAGNGEGNGDEWHASERGELVVGYLEPAAADSPGGLSVGAKGEAASRLLFSGDGGFTTGDRTGRWQLWPDGSLELSLSNGSAEVRERIWFTKPNLRLRSTVENGADGTPSRASFCSEIRRVSRPASPAAPAAG